MRATPEPVRVPARTRWVASGCAGGADPCTAAIDATRAALRDAPDPALIIAFATGVDDLAAAGAGLAAAAGDVPVIGCSAPVALPGLAPRPAGVTAAALGGEGLAVSTAVVDATGGLREAGAEAAACIGDVADREHQALLLLVDARYGDPQDVVRGAYSVVGAGVPLAGGGGGSDVPGAPMLLHGAETHERAVVAAAIGSDAPISVGVRHGLRAVGEPLLITRVDGLRVLELDDRPALDVYLEHLGCEAGDEETIVAVARANPLGVSRRAGEEQIRTVIAVDLHERSLTVLGRLPEGGLAWRMTGDDRDAAQAARSACDQAVAGLGASPAGLLVFASIGRRPASGAAPTGAITPDGVPLVVGDCMGQIARARGLVGFHNQAHAVLALA